MSISKRHLHNNTSGWCAKEIKIILEYTFNDVVEDHLLQRIKKILQVFDMIQ